MQRCSCMTARHELQVKEQRKEAKAERKAPRTRPRPDSASHAVNHPGREAKVLMAKEWRLIGRIDWMLKPCGPSRPQPASAEAFSQLAFMGLESGPQVPARRAFFVAGIWFSARIPPLPWTDLAT